MPIRIQTKQKRRLNKDQDDPEIVSRIHLSGAGRMKDIECKGIVFGDDNLYFRYLDLDSRFMKDEYLPTILAWDTNVPLEFWLGKHKIPYSAFTHRVSKRRLLTIRGNIYNAQDYRTKPIKPKKYRRDLMDTEQTYHKPVTSFDMVPKYTKINNLEVFKRVY